MRKITAQEAKQIDRRAQREFQIPALILMENAGSRLAGHLRRRLKNKESRVFFFCGAGNNAGDAFVAARHLINDGYNKIKIIVVKEQNKQFSKEAGINFKILNKLTADILFINKRFGENEIKKKIRGAELIVDGLLGIGLKGKVRGNLVPVIKAINDSHKKVVAVDLPSGLEATTGQICGVCLKASETVTFGLPKAGCFKGDGLKMSGKITNYPNVFPKALLTRAGSDKTRRR
jgi:ADP-dependent NAD(P)H-hydrate dehydratase / NAD(P)H-hydrate epimerase